MERIRELLEERARLITNARAKLDEIKDDTPEARQAEIETEANAMLSKAEGLKARADMLQRMADAEASLTAGDPRRPSGPEGRSDAVETATEVSYRDAFHQLLLRGGDYNALRPEVRNVLASGASVIPGTEARNQIAGDAGLGGNLVPDEMMQVIVKAMALWGPMFSEGFCTDIRTTGGASMPIPGVDDIMNEAQQQAAADEGNPFGDADPINFSKLTLDDFLIETGFLKASIQLVTGAMEDVEGIFADLLGERLGRKANRDLTLGTGVGQTQGIVSGSTLGHTAATGAIETDDILELYHSVDPAYRGSPKFRAMFNDDMLLALHRLKDAEGRYMVAEAPDNVGRIRVGAVTVPYAINQAVAGIGSGNRSMVMGDFAKYYVRKIGSVVIATMREAQFFPGFGIAGYARMDGAVADPRAIKHLTHA